MKNEDKLMDHNYDGIQELDNDLPSWWVGLFAASIMFAIVYLFYYEMTGWGNDQRQEYISEVSDANRIIRQKELEELKKSGQITALTDSKDIEEGKKLFNSSSQLCYTCHRADGGGLVGPNLTDSYWLHGCDIKDIVKSIKKGFPKKGMLPYGSGAKMTKEQTLQVASYILSLQGSKPENPKKHDEILAKECTHNH